MPPRHALGVFAISFLASVCAPGCTDDAPAPAADTPNARTYAVRGVAQKGPFFVGSTITIQEVSATLDPLGKVYLTTTHDHFGSFELRTPVGSPFIEVVADGQFYDEVSGMYYPGSPERIALHAFVRADDASDAAVRSVNVNLLTHLQSSRVKTLVESGMEFEEANGQARNEVLEALALPPLAEAADGIDLVGTGPASAELLAMSVLVEQAAAASHVSVTDLTGTMRLDLRDGRLDDARSHDALAKARELFARGMFSYDGGGVSPVSHLSDGLRAYYAAHGVDVVVPNWFAFFATAAP